jgi:hypothetical protein
MAFAVFTAMSQQACYGPCEIQVLDDAWNVVETINNEAARAVV